MNYGNRRSFLNLFVFTSIVIVCMLFLPVDAFADDIFADIRSKAVQTLKDSSKVVYVLGGFGLIGFAFMAIFNKISWKWFAYISISLFLVAVSGKLISYFTGDDSISQDLDYGYDMGNNTENPGTSNGYY